MKPRFSKIVQKPAEQRLQSRCEAIVVATDATEIAIKVESQHCKRCSGGCMMRLLGTADNQPVSLPIEHFSVPPSQLSCGTRVQVSFSTGLLLVLSSVVYLVPVFVMLLFAIGSNLAAPESELMLLFATCAGLASGLLGSNLLVRSLEASAKRSLVCNPMEQSAGYNTGFP